MLLKDFFKFYIEQVHCYIYDGNITSYVSSGNVARRSVPCEQVVSGNVARTLGAVQVRITTLGTEI